MVVLYSMWNSSNKYLYMIYSFPFPWHFFYALKTFWNSRSKLKSFKLLAGPWMIKHDAKKWYVSAYYLHSFSTFDVSWNVRTVQIWNNNIAFRLIRALYIDVVLQAYKGQVSRDLCRYFCVIIEMVYQYKNRSKMTTMSGVRRIKG